MAARRGASRRYLVTPPAQPRPPLTRPDGGWQGSQACRDEKQGEGAFDRVGPPSLSCWCSAMPEGDRQKGDREGRDLRVREWLQCPLSPFCGVNALPAPREKLRRAPVRYLRPTPLRDRSHILYRLVQALDRGRGPPGSACGMA